MGDKKAVAILTRAIPVEGRMTDKCVRLLDGSETIDQLLAWAKEMTIGSVIEVRLEIVKEEL